MTPRFSDHHGASEQLNRASCYRALAAKDARFDGVFFAGVKTTGIYCRPVCTAKTPRESSCLFFNTAAAAEIAGFRPCLRCRPELAPYAVQQNLAYAVWQRIAAGALNQREGSEQAVEHLAHRVGLSSRQLRRVLLQHFGVTPIELAQTQRLLFAKKLLQETELPMADVAYSAGFGSVRRFNALFAARYGMAPGAIRRAARPDANVDGGLILRLAYRPPFAWRTLLDYLALRAIPQVEAVDGSAAGAYVRSVRIQHASAHASAKASGQTSGWLRVLHLAHKNQLELHIAPALAPLLMPMLARIRAQFDLDANPAVIDEHLSQDVALAARIRATPGLRVPGAFDPFELAARAVLGQQVSVAAATTLTGRLVENFGEAAVTPFAGVTRHFPAAALLAALPVAELAGIGLPGARAQTLIALSRFAQAGGLDMAPGITLEQAIVDLKVVPGIGDWTAHYIALRALRFPDAFPAGDLGLQKAACVIAAHPTVSRLTGKQLASRAAGWSPWRGYAALMLWHALA